VRPKTREERGCVSTFYKAKDYVFEEEISVKSAPKQTRRACAPVPVFKINIIAEPGHSFSVAMTERRFERVDDRLEKVVVCPVRLFH
jgi:hypothetical protein